MALKEVINKYLKDNSIYLQDLAVEICKIPSMTGREGKKAQFIKDKLYEITSREAEIDESGNVKYILKGKNSGMLILSAHIDTVFTELQDIKVAKKDKFIYGPSIGDNTINVAALILIIKMFKELDIKPERDILFAFDTGEEGLGNLRGIKKIMKDYGDSTTEVIAVDCSYDSIVSTGVGSKRYSVSIKTEGGHSWAAFGNDNAIFYASRLIQGLYDIKVPKEPKTTYNVGVIKGGTSVNTIAEDVEMLIDLRSIDRDSLEKLDSKFNQLIENMKSDKISIDVKVLGERPAGKCSEAAVLIKVISDVRKELGLEAAFSSGSTDANIPMSMGIPAVSFGVAKCYGVHSVKEYISTDSIETGLKHLVEIISRLIRFA